MTKVKWQIPPSMLMHLEHVPTDRPIVILLRHSVRDYLPPDDTGYTLPITEEGRRLALDLGRRLRGRLCGIQTSPLLRCRQTAEALAEGAGVNIRVPENRLLGDPGVFVLDAQQAWNNWVNLGHEGVMHHLVNESTALSGMARPDEAARFLVQSMFGAAAKRPGVHIFVTHDSLVTATAARILGKPIGIENWPWYLEGAIFWFENDSLRTAYRDFEAVRPEPLCSFADSDVVEFARQQIAMTIGLETDGCFYLAGGAYKSLLTGRLPRDLDLWAPSKHDRDLLIQTLMARGARVVAPRPFADAFELGGRLVEIPFKTEPTTLRDRLALFDIGLSAIGVERDSCGNWSAIIHPLAIESARRREVRLLRPLVNWKYALTTLERMRRYAEELDFDIPKEEEEEILGVFRAQSPEMQAGMFERYKRTGSGDLRIIEDFACRLH